MRELIERLKLRRWIALKVVVSLLVFSWGALLIGWNGEFDRFSYDAQFLFKPERAETNYILLYLDDASFDKLGREPDGTLNRTNWTRLLERLTRAGSSVVLFDFDFSSSNRNAQVDLDFADAIRRHGNVVLGARYDLRELADGKVEEIVPPAEPLRLASKAWGHLHFSPVDPDRAVRRIPGMLAGHNSLTSCAATLLGVPVFAFDIVGGGSRWLNFPGPSASKSFPSRSLHEALDESLIPDHFFRGKIVIVGSRATAKPVGEVADQFATPWTRFGMALASGASIHATVLSNLVASNWLQRIPWPTQAFILFLLSGLLALAVAIFRRVPAVAAVAAVTLVYLVGAIVVAHHTIFWWNWLIPLLIMAPFGLFAALIVPPVLRPVAFISHRRSKVDRVGGSSEARLFRAELARYGWHAVLDVDDLGAGHWLPQLKKFIKRRPAFILLLSKDCFQPEESNDVFYAEIQIALEEARCIIPIFLTGFDPAQAATIPLFRRVLDWEGITYSHAHFKDMMDHLNTLVTQAVNGTFEQPTPGASASETP